MFVCVFVQQTLGKCILKEIERQKRKKAEKNERKLALNSFFENNKGRLGAVPVEQVRLSQRPKRTIREDACIALNSG